MWNIYLIQNKIYKIRFIKSSLASISDPCTLSSPFLIENHLWFFPSFSHHFKKWRNISLYIFEHSLYLVVEYLTYFYTLPFSLKHISWTILHLHSSIHWHFLFLFSFKILYCEDIPHFFFFNFGKNHIM